MTDKVRIGIVGAGKVARSRHLEYLKAVPEAEVVMAWSRTPANTEAIAKDFDIPETTTRWQDVVESPDVDAVIIATPPVMHLEATLASLAAGKHTLCQARMARNLSEALEMNEAASKSGLVTCLYPPLPGMKGDNVMRRLIDTDGYLGDVTEVHISGMGAATPANGYDPQKDPEVIGLSFLTMGMWAEVLIRWIGPATRVTATAKAHYGTRTTKDGAAAPGAVPSSVAITAEMERGAVASFHFANSATFAPPQAIEIYGTKGALRYVMFGDGLFGAQPGDADWSPIEISPEEAGSQDSDVQFVKAILGGPPPAPSFDEGLRYMEFTEAVAQSVQSGKAVDVPPEPKLQDWGDLLP